MPPPAPEIVPLWRRNGGVVRVLAGLALALLSGATAPGCGAASGGKAAVPGTVALRNDSHLTMAPRAIEAFYLQRTDGEGGTQGNLLSMTLQPGAVVIVGLFPAGTYTATAVLEGGQNVVWAGQEVRSGEPANFTFP